MRKVSAAVVIENKLVLLTRRNPNDKLAGFWEFPGGKQKFGESIQETIARELMEEMAITVLVGEELIVLDHSYTHTRLRFVVHLCTCLTGEAMPLACQQLRWVELSALENYPFPAANVRIISALLERMKTR